MLRNKSSTGGSNQRTQLHWPNLCCLGVLLVRIAFYTAYHRMFPGMMIALLVMEWCNQCGRRGSYLSALAYRSACFLPISPVIHWSKTARNCCDGNRVAKRCQAVSLNSALPAGCRQDNVGVAPLALAPLHRKAVQSSCCDARCAATSAC